MFFIGVFVNKQMNVDIVLIIELKRLSGASILNYSQIAVRHIWVSSRFTLPASRVRYSGTIFSSVLTCTSLC